MEYKFSHSVFMLLAYSVLDTVIGVSAGLYSRIGALDGRVCSGSYMIMTAFKVRSKLECIVWCKTTPDCVSTFYIKDTFVCYGCSQVYTENHVSLPRVAGTIYYKTDSVEFPSVFKFDYDRGHYWVTPTRQTYKEGQVLCEGMSGSTGTPASIASNDTAVAIQKELANRNVGTVYNGLRITDLSSTGPWVWEDTGAASTFNDWEGTEPTESQSILDSKTCVIMDRNNDYKWTNVHCGGLHRMLCEN